MKVYNGRRIYTKEEWLQAYYDELMYKKVLTIEKNKRIITRALLDSRLIIQTNREYYTNKIVECGEYIQIYKYPNQKVKLISGIEKINDKKKKRKKQLTIIEDEVEEVSDNFKEVVQNKEKPPPRDKDLKIEKRNLMRAKLQVERLAKANEKIFKTFITLTFESAEKGSIEEATKYFNIWRTKVSKVLKNNKKELSYICVPEIHHKREKKYGDVVIHFHLITNIDIDNSLIIIPQEKFTEKQMSEMSEEARNKCKDVKYWSYGYSSVYSIENENVVGYMTKYMSKEADCRLMGKRRYLASRNLKKPSVTYLDVFDDEDFYKLLTLNKSMEITYESVYSNPYGEPTFFIEGKVSKNEI